MTTLSEQIFAINDMKVEQIVVPEWGDLALELRSMTALEKSQVTERAIKDPLTGQIDIGLMYALCIIACVFDPTSGEQVFKEGDEIAILSKSSAVVERVAQKIIGQSGMSGKAVEKAQERFPTQP